MFCSQTVCGDSFMLMLSGMLSVEESSLRSHRLQSGKLSMINETTFMEQRKGIKWNATVFMILFHIGALAALFTFSWRALLVSILLWWITASLGVGMGFHRLLTHRGY